MKFKYSSSQIQRQFCLFFILCFSVVSFATENIATTSASTYFLCKYGSDVRTIRVQLNGQSCKAFYTKQGVDQLVGKSGTPAVCVDVVDKIKKNLETGNWVCKDMGQTRVSSSQE